MSADLESCRRCGAHIPQVIMDRESLKRLPRRCRDRHGRDCRFMPCLPLGDYSANGEDYCEGCWQHLCDVAYEAAGLDPTDPATGQHRLDGVPSLESWRAREHQTKEKIDPPVDSGLLFDCH